MQRNHQFSGREDLLEKIHSILKPDISDDHSTFKRRVAVLYGLGGMGKSQISIEYAYRYSSAYTSVLMVDATSQATLSRSAFIMVEQLVSHYKTQWGDAPDFTQLGVQLGLSGCIDQHGRLLETSSADLATIGKAVKGWLSNAENNDWLVVFDNHDDIETVALEDFVPTVDFGKVIITSRRTEVRHLGKAVEVDEIGKGAGIQILLSSAGKDPKNTEESGKITLSHAGGPHSSKVNRPRRSGKNCRKTGISPAGPRPGWWVYICHPNTPRQLSAAV